MARHLAEPVSKEKTFTGPLSSLRSSKGLQWPITGVSALGLVLGLGLPAHATPLAADDTTTTGIVKLPPRDVQTLTVSDKVASPVVTRDSFGATDPAVLAAKQREEAEKKAAQEQAEALKRLQEARAAATAVAASQTVQTAKANGTPLASNFVENPPSSTYSGDAVVAYAEQFVGVVSYSSGASPEAGFMCDGLTQYVFGKFGVSLPRGVDHQAAQGVPIAPADARAGDVVVWPGQHIGIYDGHGGVIHSPNWGRKVTHANQLWGSYKFYRFLG